MGLLLDGHSGTYLVDGHNSTYYRFHDSVLGMAAMNTTNAIIRNTIIEDIGFLGGYMENNTGMTFRYNIVRDIVAGEAGIMTVNQDFNAEYNEFTNIAGGALGVMNNMPNNPVSTILHDNLVDNCEAGFRTEGNVLSTIYDNIFTVTLDSAIELRASEWEDDDMRVSSADIYGNTFSGTMGVDIWYEKGDR